MMKRLVLVLCCYGLLMALAQAQPDADEIASAVADTRNASARLNDIQVSIAAKTQQISELQQQLVSADGQQRSDLQQRLDKLNKELSNLQQTFEQIATDGVDLEVFTEQSGQFDWRNELIQVTRPLLENLKSLTEKPRKIERLRSEIEQSEGQLEAARQALTAVKKFQDQRLSGEAAARLEAVIEQWQTRVGEIERKLEVRRYQLANLLGQNTSWWEVITKTTSDFFHNRGLTLLLATLAATIVWLLMRGLRWLQKKKFAGTRPGQRNLRRRLVSYGYRLFTTLLMIAAVIIVFYVRGDLLLLALTLVILGFALISFRQTLPRFVNEFKLLLNIGAVREHERILYNGLPWQVKSINLYSVLRNPELEGIIRLPLACLVGMQSRPCGEEPWFPTRAGDFILLPDGLLGEMLRQTPEVVQIKIFGGMIKEYPSTQFAGMGCRNLSRGGVFAVAITFGVDYRYQDICLDEIPATLRRALEHDLKEAGFGDNIVNITVDFKEAAASSLDYLVAVTLQSTVAMNYYKIQRQLQQICVRVCNEQGWEIPFTQLTVHTARSADPVDKPPELAMIS